MQTVFVKFNDGTEVEIQEVEEIELTGDIENGAAVLVLGPHRRPRAFFDLREVTCWYATTDADPSRS